MQPDRQRRTWNIGKPLLLGFGAVAVTIVAFGIWSVLANISGAVIGTGVIEVSTTRTAVQHQIGGVVVEIAKANGAHVDAGEVVLRLDDRSLRSDLAVTEGALFETLANIARLEAALEGNPTMALHPLLAEAAAANPEVRGMVARMQRQLDDHFAALETEMRLLDEQIMQTQAQIDGVSAQLAAKTDELVIITGELKRAQDLLDQGLIKGSELAVPEKANVTARGELGRLTAQVAELRGKIAQSGLMRLSVVTDANDLIGAELSKLRPDRTRLLEERNTILGDLARLDIRAPVAGQIIDSKVMGLQSVVVAASPLMMIVPENEPILARVRISSTDIDQVFLGQDASLKFKSFNGRQIPIILGKVMQVSADAFLDQRTQRTYYEVAIELTQAELAKTGTNGLIPGMPVEAFIATESRTPISYLMRPILFYFERAFRDA